MTLPTLDDPWYYLNNFHTVLDWIHERYRDLLSERELAFIESFPALPQASRALLVRMIMRKGTLFRSSKLRYAEIGPTPEAALPLINAGWVDAEPELSLEQLFALSTKAEIVAAFGAYLEAPGARKPDLLEALKSSFGDARRFDAWYESSDDGVYELTLMAMCDRFRLLFFGNLHQSWTEFVLADLGIYRYESVEFSVASRAFQCRADVDAYLHLHHCRERFEAGEPLAEIIDAVPGAFDENPWLESRRAKLLFQIGQYCERSEALATALTLYADCAHPGARIRRLRVLERSGQHNAALTLAREAEQAPESAAETQHLLRILPRLHRKLGLPAPSRRASAPVERIDLLLPRPTHPISVEGAVCEHLGEPHAPVHYVENTLINSLFGLLCWQAIFAPLPGAFFHPFHSGPADLLRPDFYRQRAALFDACLAQLDSHEYRATINANFMAKQGIQSPFVHWGVVDESLLEQALACFPRDHLKKWFTRLLGDIKANRAGLPDLIQFWPEHGSYRMIEVKGPGDRLQDNQLRWLDFCAEHGMPVTVCYVQWQESSQVIRESTA
ncbi:MAG TPA: VRR-NUC domain-containing protein [Modicisalibacter sp.]|nr:VRR-NUC domain-containing protein [Modicisalibacter sp.]